MLVDRRAVFGGWMDMVDGSKNWFKGLQKLIGSYLMKKKLG
jgi:hypothetical protein